MVTVNRIDTDTVITNTTDRHGPCKQNRHRHCHYKHNRQTDMVTINRTDTDIVITNTTDRHGHYKQNRLCHYKHNRQI